MAVTSGFFNSLYGDRKYTAEQFSALFNGLINDGVFSNIGTAFRVSATTDNNITIGIGRAWFNGIWVNNDALLPMTCNDPEVLLDRIDAVVIEINRSEAVRAGRIIFVKGTASGTPVNPTLTHDESVDQYPLAYIRRKAGVSAVVQADITNCIGTSACPYVTGILETQNIDNVVAQWESMFNIWFDGLQVELEGDVAANLASQVIDLNMRFNELAETRTVTVELQDSSLDTIEDSTGSAILGSTVLGESEGSTDSDIVIAMEPEHKVGDMLTTVRTSLGLNWLLCNGAVVDRADYPDLSPFLATTSPYVKKDVVEDSDFNKFPKIIYANGYYVAIGVSRGGRPSYEDVFVYYATSLDGPWTSKRVWGEYALNTSSLGRTDVYDIIYADGYFIASGSKLQSDNDERGDAIIAYATSPNATWTTKIISSAGQNNRTFIIKKILHANDQFVLVGMDYYPTLFYASSITASTWNEKQLSNGSDALDDCTPVDVIYAEEYYTVLLNSSSAIRSIRSKTLNANWISNGTITTWTTDYVSGHGNPNLLYVNDKHITISLEETLTDVFTLYAIEGITSALTKHEICNATRFGNIIYTSDRMFMVTALSDDVWKIYYANELEGPWMSIDLDIPESEAYRFIYVYEVNGQKVVIGLTGNEDTGTFRGTPFVMPQDETKMIIPEISPQGLAYTFIKAKE